MKFNEAVANLAVIRSIHLLNLHGQGVRFLAAVYTRGDTPIWEIRVTLSNHSAEQFEWFFQKVIGAFGESGDRGKILISDNQPGILFSKVSTKLIGALIVSTIPTEENPWCNEFKQVVRAEQFGKDQNWVTALYKLMGENSLWLKTPVLDSSKIYVGGFRTIEATSDFLAQICASGLPFETIGVLAIKKRAWNGELDFPGKYAIVIVYL